MCKFDYHCTSSGVEKQTCKRLAGWDDPESSSGFHSTSSPTTSRSTKDILQVMQHCTNMHVMQTACGHNEHDQQSRPVRASFSRMCASNVLCVITAAVEGRHADYTT